MFKYIFFAVLLALAVAEPKPQPKPGFIAAPLVATPLEYTSDSYTNSYSAYNIPLSYNDYYRLNYAAPYPYNYIY